MEGKYCKTIAITKNDIYTDMVPELFSNDVSDENDYYRNTILGKTNQTDDGEDLKPNERRFAGPVWALISDQYEWNIGGADTSSTRKAKSLFDGTKLHNGFYYGNINNDLMKIGIYTNKLSFHLQ